VRSKIADGPLGPVVRVSVHEHTPASIVLLPSHVGPVESERLGIVEVRAWGFTASLGTPECIPVMAYMLEICVISGNRARR